MPVVDLDLHRGPECAREARTAIEESLPEGPLRDSLEVIASELVTNAFVHGHGEIHCLLLRIGSGYRIEVSNESNEVEFHVSVDHMDLDSEKAESEGGRGLTVVRSLSNEMGYSLTGNRLTVWAVVTDQSA